MRKQAYLAGDGIARDRACPLCRQEESGGHILGACLHKDMKKQYIARHDKAMRAVVQAFTKGRHGAFYLIADVGHLEGLKEIGVHSKRVPAFVLPTGTCTTGALALGWRGACCSVEGQTAEARCDQT